MKTLEPRHPRKESNFSMTMIGGPYVLSLVHTLAYRGRFTLKHSMCGQLLCGCPIFYLRDSLQPVPIAIPSSTSIPPQQGGRIPPRYWMDWMDPATWIPSCIIVCTHPECNKRFTGYHPESMKKDAHRFEGFFNFHFSGRFAVDEELYSFIVGCHELSAKKIYGVLESMAVAKYFSTYQLYLHAAQERKIKFDRPDVSRNDRQQRTLEGAGMAEAPPAAEITEAMRAVTSLRNQVHSAKMAHDSAQSRAANNISFKELHRVKCSRNVRAHDDMPKALGPKKLKQLMDIGILNARQLTQCDIIPQEWIGSEKKRRTFRSWQEICSRIFVARETVAQEKEEEVATLEDQLKQAQEELRKEQRIREAAEADFPPPKPPLLTRIDDKKGYNVRVLSAARIDQILMTDFMNRKCLQVSKMACQPCQVLKLEYSYKLPAKIDVYTGIGKCYKPHKCMLVAHNGNNATVYWKALVGTESIAQASHGLAQLEDRNPDEVKVIYVDNCCNVAEALLKIFPNAVIKLDAFHWMKRFEPALHDKNSESAAQFRGMLRRCLFMCDDGEFKRAAATCADSS